MPVAQALLLQTCIMFMLMGLGMALYRLGILTKRTAQDLGGMLIKVVLPVVIVRSFWGSFSPERLQALGITFTLSLALLCLAILISRTCFRTDGVDEFCAAFSNAGFIGIPLVQSALGTEAVFFIACFIAQLNALQWTYGKRRIARSDQPVSARSVLANPMLVALVIGIALFCLRIPTNPITSGVVDAIAALNTPFAMIVLGVSLAEADWRSLFTTARFWTVSIARLVVIPAASLALLWLLPGSQAIKLALLIAASAPAGSNAAVFCQQLQQDPRRASSIVCLSTVLSLATIPTISAIGSLVL